MHKLFTANSKTEKLLKKYISLKPEIKKKLNRLKQNPIKSLNAHPLHGKFKGKWAC